MICIKKTLPLFFSLGLGLLCLSQWSDAADSQSLSQDIGKAVGVTGKAWIARSKSPQDKIKLEINTPIQSGDVLTTEGDARVQVLLGKKEASLLIKNQSQLTLRRNSDQSLLVELNRGMLLSSIKPHPYSPKSHYQVKTPAATFGVRGTVFFVKVNPQQTFLCTCSGMISIDDKALVLGKDHNTPRIIDTGTQPVAKRLKASPPSTSHAQGANSTDHSDAEIAQLNQLLD
jgi:hypothetical protein